jgi:hypothetical protein
MSCSYDYADASVYCQYAKCVSCEMLILVPPLGITVEIDHYVGTCQYVGSPTYACVCDAIRVGVPTLQQYDYMNYTVGCPSPHNAQRDTPEPLRVTSRPDVANGKQL